MELDQFIKLLKEQGIEEGLEEIPDEFFAKWGPFFMELDAALSSFINEDDLEGYNLFIELVRRVIETKLARHHFQKQMASQTDYHDFFWKSLWNKDEEE